MDQIPTLTDRYTGIEIDKFGTWLPGELLSAVTHTIAEPVANSVRGLCTRVAMLEANDTHKQEAR